MSKVLLLIATVCAVVLAACSAPSPESVPPPSPRAPTNAPIVATNAPTNFPAVVQATQPLATQPSNHPTIQPPNHPTAQNSGDAGIPSGATAEGYFYLGNPNAKVTVIDYSDFL